MIKVFNKKLLWIIILVLLIVVIGVIGLNIFNNFNKTSNMNRMEYRTDTQPLINRFGETIKIESCFWKADTIGKTNFGPSSYWMKGFIIINHDDLVKIKAQYPMKKADVRFDNGVTPDITGFSGFEWSYNKELSHKIAGAGFVGEFYLDIKNGVIYFDLESN